jgi:hypothetical protein
VIGTSLFAVRAGELITLLAKARREDRTDHIEDRIGQFFLVVLGQSGVLRDPIPGIAHFFTFWGFIIIQFGLLNLMLQVFGLSLLIIGESSKFSIMPQSTMPTALSFVFCSYPHLVDWFVIPISSCFVSSGLSMSLSFSAFLSICRARSTCI